jgi:transposase
MESVPVYVGLDYHSGSVQVCVVDQAGRMLVNRRCGNSVAEVAEAVGPGRAPARVAVEACCGAADFAEDLAGEAGWRVALAHPGYVARMKHNPDKTDYSDARMLAELCRAGMLPEVWLAPAPVRELRALVRYRAEQVHRRTDVKMRILATLREQRITEPPARRWTRAWVAWLRGTSAVSPAGRWAIDRRLEELESVGAHVRAAEARLEEATADDPLVARLRSMRGIGPVTAWTMRAMIGRFDRFANGKQLARYCALTPRNASSGRRQGDSGLIRAGDPALKGTLIQAAHTLRRFDPKWRAFYERLRDSGKPACVAVAAVANRWVRSLHHQLKETPMAA